MCVALIVVVALFVAPELLVQYAPGWRSTVGAILLGVSLVSVSRAIAQILKAGVLLVLWSGVALVLASQVFLQKMPYAIERSDVMRLEGFFTSETARGAFRDVFDVLKGRHALSKMFGALGPMLPEAQRVVTEAQPELLLRRAGLLGQRLNQVSTSEFSQNRQEMS
jgi:predicted membrane channel-forming protein YqfA (hemolysin III family)